jgi:tetratricopeptide (TPR) repeat protein
MLSPPFTLQKVIVLAVLAVAVWAYAIWQLRGAWRQYRRQREVVADRGLRPSATGRHRRTLFTAVFVAAVVLLVAYMGYVDQFGTPADKDRVHLVEARVGLIMTYVMGVLMALVALLVVLYWAGRDRAVTEVAKLALAGRDGEAETVIRNAIQSKGANERRLTVLGLLLMEQNRLEEALQPLQEAVRLSKRPGTAKNNCGMVLWKLGRREEAAQFFDEARLLEPTNFVAVTNSCLILAELGREREAFDRLAEAERLFEQFGRHHLSDWRPLLEKCREAVPTARGFPVIR